jgi:quercetin dioxygenase-like cupin family protein
MRTNSDNFVFEQNLPWEPAGEGVSRQIMGYDGQIMTVKVRFEQGAQGYTHHHIHAQTTYVVSGKFAFTIGGQTRIVQTGDGLYMEPNVEHGCECLEAGILIDTFTPMRSDFLND